MFYDMAGPSDEYCFAYESGIGGCCGVYSLPIDYLQLIMMAGGPARNPHQIFISVYDNFWSIERKEWAAVKQIFETPGLVL